MNEAKFYTLDLLIAYIKDFLLVLVLRRWPWSARLLRL